MKIALAALVALALVTPPTTPVPVIKHPDYGVVTSVQFLDGVPLLRMQDLGIGIVRVDIGWGLVEATQGRYDFDQIQTWVDEAHNARLQIYASLGGPPLWAAPCSGCMPYDLYQWYDYVFRVISRFRYLGSDITFGIWNEPNLGQFLNPPDPDAYGDLFDFADMARRDANPAARLAGPETEFGALASGWFASALARMTPRLAPQDIITVHWYPGTRSPDLQPYMTGVLAAVGARETWLTETGKFATDDAAQAAGVLDIVQTFNRRPSSQWAKLFIYRLAGEDPTDPAAAFQFLKPDALSSPRPSFLAYHDHMFRMLTVTLQASGGQYLIASNGGGAAIRADSGSAGAWETFTLDDLNGGSLVSGDFVRLQASSGAFAHVTRPNQPLEATDSCGCALDSMFTVISISPGVTTAGPRIALRSAATGQYVSANGGGGGAVLVDRPSAGASETFRLTVR
jgi:hypothetical protein